MFAANSRALSRTARASFSSSSASAAREAVIVSMARTPIASMGGSLASVSATDLGAAAITGALERAGLKGSDVQEVYMGNVCSAGIGQAPAKQAALAAGIPDTVPCTTVNKVCASGLKSIQFAAQAVMLGHHDVMVAGGMESMSQIPYYVEKARDGYRYGHGQMTDGLLKDGLWDPYNDQHMGMCGEVCAETYGISREEQDAYAVSSYERSAAASEAGCFKSQIVPVTVKSRRGDVVVDEDEEFKRVKFDKVASLRPAFKRDGTVTAVNASTLNDGAAAVVVMSADKAAELGIKPLAKILGFGDAAKAPVEFTTAPSDAVPVALRMAGLEMSDVEYHEINEAFSVVALANMKIMGLDHDRVNVNGGAVALGHPLGASGARIVTTLLGVLEQKGAKIGAASICNGGGGAGAMILERM
jgi:acetyl-CoA C-acetyltransferase